MIFKFKIVACWAFMVTAYAEVTSLLLPGFRGRQLEARELEKNDIKTTFIVTCVEGSDPSECGISTHGLTAVAGENVAEVTHVNEKHNTAWVICDTAETTYASCLTQQTVSVRGTLAPKDLNWIEVTMITPGTTLGSTLPTGTSDITTQHAPSPPESSESREGLSHSQAIPIFTPYMSLYWISVSAFLGSIGSALMLGIF
ncbi:hypothetical protein N7533_011221 [Penicillium manginii]|uniref:uncharacterized protein n=1 Tax=Penicillium manginii TaxID=203109 RepID=UPI002546BCA2|nr:uncharacterized protein N7533_011221 [Penicillium manginii]KAJ5741812.1 hypothetical protein N7533_011221 [Penicillium manginii]